MNLLRLLISRLRGPRVKTTVVTTRDPDEYAAAVNRFILRPAGLLTTGPRFIAKPAQIEVHLKIVYVPPDADALVAAVAGQKEDA